MNPLVWPRRRTELISWLEEIATSESDPDFDIDEIIHFFFDDTDLFPATSDEVGWFIYAEEVSPLRDLISRIDNLVSNLGDVGSDKYIKAPEWAEIKDKAEQLASAIKIRDRRARGGWT